LITSRVPQSCCSKPYAADIAYFYGEGARSPSERAATDPAIPAGYQFDFVCRDTLLHDFVVKDGRLTTESGMRIKSLILPSSTKQLTLALLKQLREFVNAA